jgi:hypothetical protein
MKHLLKDKFRDHVKRIAGAKFETGFQQNSNAVIISVDIISVRFMF